MIGPFIKDGSSNTGWEPYEVDGVLVLSRMQCTDGSKVYGFSKNYTSDYLEYPGVRLFGGYYSPIGNSSGKLYYSVCDLCHRFENVYGFVLSSTYLSLDGITGILAFPDVCYITYGTCVLPVYKGGRLPIRPGAYIKAVK